LDLRAFSDRDDLEFSPTGQSGWLKGSGHAKLVDGAVEIWVRSDKPGYFNVTVQADGYEITPARVHIAEAAPAAGPKGSIKITADVRVVAVGTPVRLDVAAMDAGGQPDTSVENLTISDGRAKDEFSLTGEDNWSRGPIKLKLTAGAARVWLRPATAGELEVSVTSGADGRDMTAARLRAGATDKAGQRSLDVDIEDDKGVKRTLKLKFRR
jgi:hypothetical protein